MNDYRKMYYHLFNQVTSVIHELQIAQQETEEIYMAQTASLSALNTCGKDGGKTNGGENHP